MQVTRIATTDELRQFSTSWNCLTRGVPFRSWEWLSAWWQHYGTGRELYTLVVRDEAGTLLGILPLFRELSATRGRVLKLLGSGEVCSDYVSVLSTNEHEDAVIDAVANWMINANAREASHDVRWDLLELDGVLTSDAAMGKLVGALAESDCGVHRKPGVSCWKLPLPATWDEFFGGLSKNRRKAFRKLDREVVDCDRLVFKIATTQDDFRWAMKLFVELHQKRRVSLGESGCFASPEFTAFIEDVSQRLWLAGMLELSWIELDGSPAAVDYSIVSIDTVYAYQGGLDPAMIAESPGHLLTMALIRRAITESRAMFDLLRGDEPYKAAWRAQPHATVNLRISANRTTSQLRQGVWLAGAAMKNWVKGGLTLTGMQ